jgi:hypothetical protein
MKPSRLIWQLARVSVRINFHVHAKRKRKQRNCKFQTWVVLSSIAGYIYILIYSQSTATTAAPTTDLLIAKYTQYYLEICCLRKNGSALQVNWIKKDTLITRCIISKMLTGNQEIQKLKCIYILVLVKDWLSPKHQHSFFYKTLIMFDRTKTQV